MEAPKFGAPREDLSRPFAPAAETEEEPGRKSKGSTDWSKTLGAMTLMEKLDLRAQIERSLPVGTLSNVNLERELLLQWQAHQELQNNVITDDEVPANQRAQVANATRGALESLAKWQESVHSSERIKRMETVLIATLSALLPDVTETFLKAYEEELTK